MPFNVLRAMAVHYLIDESSVWNRNEQTGKYLLTWFTGFLWSSRFSWINRLFDRFRISQPPMPPSWPLLQPQHCCDSNFFSLLSTERLEKNAPGGVNLLICNCSICLKSFLGGNSNVMRLLLLDFSILNLVSSAKNPHIFLSLNICWIWLHSDVATLSSLVPKLECSIWR